MRLSRRVTRLMTSTTSTRDGLVSVNDMASAIQSFGESAVQAMVALMQAREQIDSLVQNGIRTIEMAGLTADQRNEIPPQQAERARCNRCRTDPEDSRHGQSDHRELDGGVQLADARTASGEPRRLYRRPQPFAR